MVGNFGTYRAARIHEGIAEVVHPSGDKALWTRVKLRKEATCPVSRAELRPGDMAYRPVGNQAYRYVRIAAAVIDALPIER